MIFRHKTDRDDVWIEEDTREHTIFTKFGPGSVGAFVGSDEAEMDETVRYVRVMSKAAGGQIRGYFVFRDTLRLALPSYIGQWKEMDDAVAKALGLPVQPYAPVKNRPSWHTPA